MKAASWTSYEHRLDRMTAYIYEHLDDSLDLQTLADVAAMSPFHWHRIYHAIRGETIAGAVKRLRLQRAAVDLAQSPMRIEDVAARAGYSSVPAFSRAFGEAYGLPPGQYREAGSHVDFRPDAPFPPRGGWSIEVRGLAETSVLSMAHSGAYIEIGRTFEALFTRLAPQDRLRADLRMVAIFYDDPTAIAEDRLRSRAAVIGPTFQNAASPAERAAIAGGDYAILRHKGPYANMRAAYLWLFGTWLPQSGRDAADAPVFEEYLNNPRDTPPTELLTDLCLPLKPL
jgi:AraC family transcriptional regulator